MSLIIGERQISAAMGLSLKGMFIYQLLPQLMYRVYRLKEEQPGNKLIQNSLSVDAQSVC
jgi:hypothetical protein